MFKDMECDIMKYVHFKVKRIHSNSNSIHDSSNDKILFQIIDVSNKMLYNEFKAEKSFLTLINAAVSHELRNPLNSLTGQISSMLEFFSEFRTILK